VWTDEQRKAHKPRGEGYASDVNDEEWAIIEPMIPPARTGGASAGLTCARCSTQSAT
jgi:hypothetical protein